MRGREPLPLRLGRGIRATIPAIDDWETGRGAIANLLLFALAALGGEWIVHQIEYLIVYGARFGGVMATTPHRLYMAPEGLILAAMAQGFAVLLGGGLVVASLERKRLLALLPERLRDRVPSMSWQAPALVLFRTAMALAFCQLCLYFIQENLESLAMGMGWPGLAVLISPQRATVIPLHLVMATCGSLILWAVAVSRRRSRGAVDAVRALVRLLHVRKIAPIVPRPSEAHVPTRRIVAGAIGLRAPPHYA